MPAPADHRPFVPNSVVRTVLRGFGVDADPVESIRLLASRERHATWRIEAAGRAWVLKQHAGGPSLRQLSESHRWEQRLAEAGFPVAPIQMTASGQSLVRDGAASYSLHGWVPGQQFSIAERDDLIAVHPQLVTDLGAAIGHLHRISADLPLPQGGAPVSVDALLTGPAHIARAIVHGRFARPSLWHSLRRKRRKSDFDRWIITVLPGLLRRADSIAELSITPPVPIVDTGLIHNDLNWENLIFGADHRLCAILDFDNATRAPWVMEVGAAAVVLVGTEPRHVEDFVAAYENASGSLVDRDLVRLAMTVKCVRSILVSARTYLGGRATDEDRLASWCAHLHESLSILDEWS